MLSALAISGYRSLRSLVVPLGRLNVITGPNDSGKSNLYRALRLLADTAQGQAIPSLAREGGLARTLWAGPTMISRAMQRGEAPVEGPAERRVASLRLGFAGDEYGYLIDLGYPPQAPDDPSLFRLDPDIKRECIWHGRNSDRRRGRRIRAAVALATPVVIATDREISASLQRCD